jgi:hypothetical protein
MAWNGLKIFVKGEKKIISLTFSNLPHMVFTRLRENRHLKYIAIKKIKKLRTKFNVINK